DHNLLVGAIVGGFDAAESFADYEDIYEQIKPATYYNAPLLGILARLHCGHCSYNQLLLAKVPVAKPIAAETMRIMSLCNFLEKIFYAPLKLESLCVGHAAFLAAYDPDVATFMSNEDIRISTRYGGWWLEPSAKTPAHGAKTTPWVAFSRLAPPPPAEMVKRKKMEEEDGLCFDF
ncbi:endoglucanase 6-like protein, partial [Tanacetum coccineum]